MTAPIIVIGAGHNGLTAAAYLAKAGRSVLVLESREHLGGLAGGDMFHPGHRSLGVLSSTQSFRPWIAKELSLAQHGLQFADGFETITGHGDGLEPLYLRGGLASGAVSQADKQQYAEFSALIERIRGPILKLMDRPPLNPRGSVFPLVGPMLSIRALGAEDMTTLMRVPPMCVADWMRDHFSNERLGALIAHGGLIGNMAGPWSPWTAANLMFDLATTGRPVIGGAPTVVSALSAAVSDFGATVRTSATVARVLTKAGRVTGVELADGEKIDTNAVLASCDPRGVFERLIGARHLNTQLSRHIRNIRTRGVSAALDLAFTKAPLDTAGREIANLRTGVSLDSLERAYDPAKYGELPDDPMVTLKVTPTPDSTEYTASALVQFVPHSPKSGWTDETKRRLTDVALKVLDRASPGLRESVVASRLRTPADLEEEFHLTGGHIFHGEHAPDQLMFMRPITACAEYRTPISGLYLCGSGSHPGGGITGVPGALGARALMKS